MKYHSQFKNKYGDEFTVSSMEEYVVTDADIEDFTKVLDDAPVRNYITNEAMSKYGHATTESLAKDILLNSALRWGEGSEFRFLVRDAQGKAVGMIGADLEGEKSGELWYYKISSAPAFMYEALLHVLDFLKKEGIEKLTATFELDNHRSIKILSDLGFKNSFKSDMMELEL